VEGLNERRAELLCELAAVHEHHLGQSAEAVPLYEQAFAADPGHAPAVAGLRRLHERHGAWDALTEVLARAAGAAATPAEQLALHLERGNVLGQLQRFDEAARAFEDALAVDGTSAAARFGLKESHRSAGRSEAFLEAVEAELGDTPADLDRRVDLAAAWEDHGRNDRALAVWRRILEIDPRHLGALHGLERTLARTERWADLAEACQAHLAVVDGADRVAVLVELAAVRESRLDDVAGAIAALEEVHQAVPEHRGAIDALGRLYERAGRAVDALAMLEKLAGGDPDRKTRAELAQRAGRIHLGQGDLARAEASMRAALALDSSNAGALEGLGELRRTQGQWEPAAQGLVDAAEQHRAPADVIRCLRAAAELYRHRLRDAERARACLTRVLELDAQDAEAKRDLGEILSDAGQWDALWPHLEQRVAELTDKTPLEERIDVLVRAARCAAGMREFARSLELFDRALANDANRVPLQLSRADVLLRAEDWDAAQKAYHKILVHHAAALEKADAVGIHRQLGRIHERLGRAPQAIAFYGKALELDGTHRATLEDLARLHVAARRYDDAVADLRALAEAVPREEKPQVLERAADLQRDHLKNPTRAVSMYLDAVEIDPQNHRVLQKLLDLQSELGQWKPALDTIARFVALEPDPPRRALYHLASANIRRFKVKDDANALSDLERAIDCFFEAGTGAPDAAVRLRALEAFQGIDEILTEQKEWKKQERAYRAMIKRLPVEDSSLSMLWHNLGEIYRSRLGKTEEAVHAFETAHALDPQKDPRRVQILAELIGRQNPDKASEHATRLVENDPDNPDVWRALAVATLNAGKVDEAWCACRALVVRRQARPEEEAFYRRFENRERRRASNVLDEDGWAHVRDPGEDLALSWLFARVRDAAVLQVAGPRKRFELRPKEKLDLSDPASPSSTLAKIIQYAVRVLNVPLPEVYVQPQRTGRLFLASCLDAGRLEPTFIVGRDLLGGTLDTEVAYWVASTAAMLRPAYYLRLALPSLDELEAVLLASSAIGGKTVQVRPQLAPLVESFGTLMQKQLSPRALGALPGLISRLPEAPDVQRWANSVDTAARRAALLVCGELAAAVRMAGAEPVRPGGPRPVERARDLLLYSVSPAYFAARRHLNVTVPIT
jgi:tetratricopeptide (TPR) repeat protein